MGDEVADGVATAEDFTQWLLSPLLGVADYFTSLPLHPVFNTVHFILTAFALRNEPGEAYHKLSSAGLFGIST